MDSPSDEDETEALSDEEVRAKANIPFLVAYYGDARVRALGRLLRGEDPKPGDLAEVVERHLCAPPEIVAYVASLLRARLETHAERAMRRARSMTEAA